MMRKIEIPVLSETELLQYFNQMFRELSTKEKAMEMDNIDKIFLSCVQELSTKLFSNEDEIKSVLRSFPNYKLTSELFKSIVEKNPPVLQYIGCFHKEIWIYQPNKNELDILTDILSDNGDLYCYLSPTHKISLPLLSIVLNQDRCRNNPDIIACIPIKSLQLNILALMKVFPDLSEKINNNKNISSEYNKIKNSFNFQLLIFNLYLKWLLIIGWSLCFGILGFISLTYAAAAATVSATVTPLFLLWTSIAILLAIISTLPIIADSYYIQPLSRPVKKAERTIVSTLREHHMFNDTKRPSSELEQGFFDITQAFRTETQTLKMKTITQSVLNGARLSWGATRQQ